MSIKHDPFITARNNVMNDIKHEAAKRFGSSRGQSKLARAAWALVAGRPSYDKYLYGKESGSVESYGILAKINSDAVKALDILKTLQLYYNRDGNFDAIWSDPLRERQEASTEKAQQPVDNSRDSFEDHSDNKYEKCLEKLKPVFALLIGSSLSFFLDSFLLSLPFLIFLAAFFLLPD